MLFRKKHPVEKYQEIGKSLKDRLGLETEIVSMKFIKNTSEIPGDFIRPLRDLNRKMTICMAMADARKDGKKLAITADDNPCTPVSVAHGWVKVPMLALIKSQVDNKWQKNTLSVIRGSLKRLKLGGWLAHYPLNRFLAHKGVIISPLSDTPFVPDTVVIYSNPEQMTHVVHSLSFEGKHVPQAVLTGFAESCFTAGLIPSKSGKPVFTLIGMGERVLKLSHKNEVAMGMPGYMSFYVNDNLFKTGGEHNLKHALENHPVPLEQLDESFLPGWTDVRKMIRD